MTGNIKGPESPRLPPTTGSAAIGGTPGRPDLALDSILSQRDGTERGRLTTRLGAGQTAPSGGTEAGRRLEHLRNSLSEGSSRLSRVWPDFTAGTLGFAALLGQIASGSSGPGRTDSRGEIAHLLRRDLPVGDLLRTLPTSGPTPLADPSLRSMGPDDARRVTDLTASLIDQLFGAEGEGGSLADHLPQPVLTRLRAEADKVTAGLSGEDRAEATRSLAREVIFQRALLPELLGLAGRPDSPEGLDAAVLFLHALLGQTGTDRLSPDLATALAPLQTSLDRRFDTVLSTLGLPGFGPQDGPQT